MSTHRITKTLGMGALGLMMMWTGALQAQPLQGPLLPASTHFRADASLDLEALSVAKIQPTAFMDSASALAMSELMAYGDAMTPDASRGAHLRDSLPKPGQDAAHEGLGFAGHSTTLDLSALQYGYMLGALPLLARADALAHQATLIELERLSDLASHLSPQTAQAIATYLKGARAGQLDTGAYMNVMRAASDGLAQAQDASQERRHGYLMVGLWSAMSALAIEAGMTPASLLVLGQSLGQLLERDASFGGSDRALAAQVHLIREQAAAASPDKARVYGAIRAMMGVKSDV